MILSSVSVNFIVPKWRSALHHLIDKIKQVWSKLKATAAPISTPDELSKNIKIL